MSNDITLAELPIEVLLDNILPYLQAPDLLRLACTSKLFSVLCSDDTLWKPKLQSDFNFSSERIPRTSNWKFIYRGLSKPRVFVWGVKANGRLARPPNWVMPCVPFPMQVPLPGVRIVSLVAGDTSYHALDSDGNVHVWGTLDGFHGNPFPCDGFSETGKEAKTPLKFRMPAPIRSISCGRLHSSCLDFTNAIWTFTNWGRPFRLSSSLLRSDPGFVPRQIECGWKYSSLLTNSGDVFLWFPFEGRMRDIIKTQDTEMDRQLDKSAVPTKEGVIPCATWDLDFEAIRLPAVPPLPHLQHTGKERSTEITQLIQIAAFDQSIIGLTNHGHVLQFNLYNVAVVTSRRWEYLPLFSDAKQIGAYLNPPQTMQITHISANNRKFTAYSTSIVLLGHMNIKATSQPDIIHPLQYKSTTSVAFGDDYSAALTTNGKLFTWGGYSHGALGLGDPFKLKPGLPGAFATEHQRCLARERGRGEPQEHVDIPTEVRFDHTGKKPRDRFCLAVTAAGSQTGALVIDLEPDEDEDEWF